MPDRIDDQNGNTFRCKECKMEFRDKEHLERHFKAAHPAKHDGFRQKWYWET